MEGDGESLRWEPFPRVLYGGTAPIHRSTTKYRTYKKNHGALLR